MGSIPVQADKSKPTKQTIMRSRLSLSVKYQSHVRFAYFLFPLLVCVLIYHSGVFIVVFWDCC